MIRVLVCGSRTYQDREELYSILDAMHAMYGISTVIQGGAKGADALAAQWATDRDVFMEQYSADWKRYGKAAGPYRNQRMLDEGRPDHVIAFPIGESKGTEDMIERAMMHHVETAIFRNSASVTQLLIQEEP